MKWIRAQEQAVPHFKSSVLTMGNFDGVHIGHQRLLKEVVRLAKENNTDSVVCTFKPHPRAVLKPQEPHHRLFDYRDQVEVMGELGIDYLVEEKFTKDFSQMSADEFMMNYVIKMFNPVHVVVGYDFSFGKSRTGNIDYLREFCAKNKIGFTKVDACMVDGKIVSSTQIRRFLEHGEVTKVPQFLGRPYYLRGPVQVGHKRGRSIGVPTANISPEIEFTPRKGVYFTWAYLGDEKFASITNIGVNPTFESNEPYLKVETNIFDFDRDIYGKHLRIELMAFHRDEMKFSSVETLKTQIHNDIAAAKVFFSAL